MSRKQEELSVLKVQFVSLISSITDEKQISKNRIIKEFKNLRSQALTLYSYIGWQADAKKELDGMIANAKKAIYQTYIRKSLDTAITLADVLIARTKSKTKIKELRAEHKHLKQMVTDLLKNQDDFIPPDDCQLIKQKYEEAVSAFLLRYQKQVGLTSLRFTSGVDDKVDQCLTKFADRNPRVTDVAKAKKIVSDWYNRLVKGVGALFSHYESEFKHNPIQRKLIEEHLSRAEQSYSHALNVYDSFLVPSQEIKKVERTTDFQALLERVGKLEIKTISVFPKENMTKEYRDKLSGDIKDLSSILSFIEVNSHPDKELFYKQVSLILGQRKLDITILENIAFDEFVTENTPINLHQPNMLESFESIFTIIENFFKNKPNSGENLEKHQDILRIMVRKMHEELPSPYCLAEINPIYNKIYKKIHTLSSQLNHIKPNTFAFTVNMTPSSGSSVSSNSSATHSFYYTIKK